MIVSEQPIPDKQQLRGGVLLLHGVLNPGWVLSGFEKYLRSVGYEVRIGRYKSVRADLNAITAHVHQQYQRFQEQLPDTAPLFLVGHSLGAIVCRALLEQSHLPRLKRVVMLAPPNGGSHVARRLGSALRWVIPVIDELSDQPGSRVNQLARRLDVETGIIAAEPDFVISPEATHLENEADFMTLPGPHSSLIFRRSAMQQTAHFLEHGRFARA